MVHDIHIFEDIRKVLKILVSIVTIGVKYILLLLRVLSIQ